MKINKMYKNKAGLEIVATGVRCVDYQSGQWEDVPIISLADRWSVFTVWCHCVARRL